MNFLPTRVNLLHRIHWRCYCISSVSLHYFPVTKIGLPIIVTPNAGGTDLVDEGKTGHIVPIRSPEKIAEAISMLIRNRVNKNEIKKWCQTKASFYTWYGYAQKIIDFNLSPPPQILDIA